MWQLELLVLMMTRACRLSMTVDVAGVIAVGGECKQDNHAAGQHSCGSAAHSVAVGVGGRAGGRCLGL